MTTQDGAAAFAADGDDDSGALRCYRHPDRETWVRCGRCDQPICTQCAMQGPVGFRCKECGRPARDPLTTIRPSQLAIGLAVAALGGFIVGLIGGQVGFFGLLLAWFGGGIIADAVIRFVGFKRGPKLVAMLFGGILVGAAAAFVLGAAMFAASFGEGENVALFGYVYSQGPWAALAAGLACFGAWSRFRF